MAGKSGQSNRHRKRKSYETKPAKPGRKSMRGQAELYDQVKKNATFSITPHALESLRVTASRLGISRSEVIERICRYLLLGDSDIVTLMYRTIKQDEV